MQRRYFHGRSPRGLEALFWWLVSAIISSQAGMKKNTNTLAAIHNLLDILKHMAYIDVAFVFASPLWGYL